MQKLLGVADKVQELKDSSDQATTIALQVRMELQADCFAGVSANLNDQLKNQLSPATSRPASTRRARSATT